MTGGKKEELVYKTDCELILMMDPVPGRIEITNISVYFFDKSQQTDAIGEPVGFLSELQPVY